MDFHLTESQQDLSGLAEDVLADQATDDRHAELDAAGEWFDPRLLRAFAETGLTGAAVAEEHGGSGLGMLEVCSVLRRIGAHAARVPYLAAIVLGALPLQRFGSVDQRRTWLPGIASGRALVTAALTEPDEPDLLTVRTTASPVSDGWILDGTKSCVPAAHLADRVLVPARHPSGELSVFLVDPADEGATVSAQRTATGEPETLLTLHRVRALPADVLTAPGGGAEIVTWIAERALTGLAALQVGAGESAIALTAQYAGERRQFGRPIATFQAVAVRAADAYIAVEANRLTMWQAAWRLDAGLPAGEQVRIAKFWASEAAATVATVAHRLHGGLGADMTSRLPRFTLLGRHIDATLGASRHQLAALGAEIAAQP